MKITDQRRVHIELDKVSFLQALSKFIGREIPNHCEIGGTRGDGSDIRQNVYDLTGLRISWYEDLP